MILILEVSLNLRLSFLSFYVDKCMKDYLGSLGTKHRIRVAQRPCLHVVRSHKDTWLRLWFEPITSNDGNVSITLKDSRGKERIKWNLKPGDSKHMRNFGAVDKGDRFEIEEQSLLAHNKFDLSFMLYSAGKVTVEHRCTNTPLYDYFVITARQDVNTFPNNVTPLVRPPR